MLIRVSASLNIFEPLTYNYTGREEDIKPGRRVIVPVGKRLVPGWVIDWDSTYTGKVKNITGFVKDDYLPDKNYLEFARAVSEIYFTSMGQLLDSSLSPKRKSLRQIYFLPEGEEETKKAEKLITYAKDGQKLVREAPVEFFYKNIPAFPAADKPFPDLTTPAPAGEAGEIHPHKETTLLSVNRLDYYRDLIADHINRGKSVLILVPDNLTARYLKQTLAGADIYNSDVKEKDRENLWQEYAFGKTGVIVGGQSAALLPIQNLGTIICERDGSSTYKRSYYSKYDTSLLAKIRAAAFDIPLIAGFSTYTSASYRRRDSIVIDDKREANPTPVEVRMLTAKDTGIPDRVIELIKGYFLKDKKVLVVLNKKESADFLFCPKCKKIQKCPRCFFMLKIKKKNKDDLLDTITCARCGFEKKGFDLCLKCRTNLTKIEEMSIASLKKSIKREVVETGLLSLSSEGIKGETGIVNRLRASKIVISTPVIINPFFKDIFDAVIYIKPESLFNINEYSAAERIFSLLSEIRELIKENGSIDVFSSFHFHYSLKLVNDEAGFFERELKYREWFRLPPFANVYHIEVKAKNLRLLGKEMRTIYNKHKSRIGIEKIYLSSRRKIKGVYKGVIEAHTLPGPIRESGLMQKKNITIDLHMI
jgi:primosomal protein N' (replication factor Y)